MDPIHNLLHLWQEKKKSKKALKPLANLIPVEF